MKRILLLILALSLSALADPPASNVVVDTSNSVTNGLKFLVYPGTTTNKNIVTGDAGTLSGTASWSGTGPGGSGSALSVSGGSDTATWPLPTGMSTSLSHNWTIFFHSNITSLTTGYAAFVGVPTTGCAGQSLAVSESNGSSVAFAQACNQFGNDTQVGSTSGYWATGNWHTYALVLTSSSATWYKDGTQIDTTFRYDNSITWTGASLVKLFSGQSGSMDVAAIWSRSLSGTELTSLTSNPYQLVTTPTATYTISGTVTSTGANAKVRLTGTSVDQTVAADASGNYTFTPVVAGSYTVTPTRLGITFSPSSSSVTLSGNQTVNFTATTIATGTVQMNVEGLAPTQAGVLITGAGSNPCTLNLFHGNNIDSPLHPDAVDSVDTSRSDTMTTSIGRLVYIGHNLNELALMEGEQYFLHAYCGSAGQATLTFTTPHPPTETTPAPPVPFDSSRPYNYGGPMFDLTQKGQKVALPYTGVAVEVPIGPYDRWWETIANLEGLGYSGVLGGSGWTIPAGSLDNVNSPSTYATTTNTNPVILLPGDRAAVRHSSVGFSAEAAGIQIWGSGTDAADANRTVNVCITTNMVAGTCDTNSDPKYSSTPYFPVTLNASGANGPVSNSATLAATMTTRGNTPWPSAYPTPGFIGWNTYIPNERLTVDNITISGIASGVVSASNFWGDSNYIPEGLKNNYLYIPGLGNVNCPNDFCPVADVLPNGQVKLASPADTITDARAFSGAKAFQYGFKVWKATSTGTISIASRYTLAGRQGQLPGTATTAICSKVSKTVGGKKGSNCLFTMSNHPRSVIWIPDNRDDVPLFRTSLSWSTGASFSNIANASDRPAGERPSGDAFWDSVDPDTLYISEQSQGGNLAIYKGVLDSNPVTDPASCITTYSATCHTFINQVVNGDSVSWQVGHVLWTNLTPASASPAMDVISQINRSYPSYAAYASGSHYGSGGFAWVGVSGQVGFMKHDGGTQDSRPCLIAAFDLSRSPAPLIRFLSTMSDSTMLAETNGGVEEMRWGGCHGVFRDDVFDNSVISSNEQPGTPTHSGAGYLGKAPMFKPTAILMKDGTWNSNTALVWPPPTAGTPCGSPCTEYQSAYSGNPTTDFKARIQQYIYAPNQYVRIKAAGSGNTATTNWVCSDSTDLASESTQTCAWDGTRKALPYTWKPIEGDAFSFSGNTQCQNGVGDCEQFVIAKINSITNTEVDFWAIRSAVRYYACPGAGQPQIDGSTNPPLGPGCLNTPTGSFSQNQPPNGWMGNMLPGIQSPEFVKRLQLNLDGSVANMVQQAGEFAGHSTAGVGMDGKTYLVGYESAVGATTLADLKALYYTGFLSTYHQPSSNRASYAGQFKQAMTQSYMAGNGRRSDSQYRGTAVDLHHIANGGGGVDCTIANGCDKRRTLTVVGGMTNVYKYVLLSATDFSSGTSKYRIFFPIYMVGGLHVFKDRSGPTCDMNTVPDYSFCYNYRTGITSGVAGSSLGDLFLKAPAVQSNTTEWFVNTGINYPYATFFGPNEGGLRQFLWQTDDYEGGRWQRFLGYTGPPGFAQGFSEPSLSTFGSKVLTHSANFSNGMSVLPLVVHLPNQTTFIKDWSKTNKPAFKSGSLWNANFEIKLDAYPGATTARVKFGTTPTFQCTEASEACVTDESHTAYTDPFAFIGEASNPTSCTSGCTLHPPLIPGRLYVIQVERLNGSGTVIKTEDAQFVSVK